jgi:AcrR family transcriptional regulator
MKSNDRQKERTRRAILDALAAEIVDSGMIDLSIQAVADRAGVTHRTVYNHFPTREALNDAFAAHVETVIAESSTLTQPPEANVDVDGLPGVACIGHELFQEHASHIRAYVMMTMATGAAAQVFRERSRLVQTVLERELGPLEPGVARAVTSAIRLFLSSYGWYSMTEHHGLTSDEAGRLSQWALEQLIAAVRRGELPSMKENDDG